MEQLIRLFESLAKEVWERLREGINLGVSQGEETISDTVLLRIASSNINRIRIRKTPKNLERQKGTDWEWWIGSNEIGWIRYAVQAKKLDKEIRYPNLAHRHLVDNELQINILERYSLANRAIPLYCFYNYCNIQNIQNYWNCCDQFDVFQFGCTITPIFVARRAIETHGGKNFRFIHSDMHTLPWRCLVACPDLSILYDNINRPMQAFNIAMQKFGQEIHIYENLPAFMTDNIDGEEFDQNINKFYSPEINIFPKRIMAVEISTGQNVPLEQNVAMA